MFEEFDKVQKQDWIRLLEKEIKENSVQKLKWKAEADILVDPVKFPEDRPGRIPFDSLTKTQNAWRSAFRIYVKEMSEANHALLNALSYDCSCIVIKPDAGLHQLDWNQLLTGAHPEYIRICIDSDASTQHELCASYFQFLQRQNISPANSPPIIRSSKPGQDRIISGQNFNDFLLLIADDEGGNFVSQIQAILERIQNLLHLEEANGKEPAEAIRHLACSIRLGDNFYLNLAAVRALRNNLHLLRKSWGMESGEELSIWAESGDSEETDENQHMIRFSAMALSALSGGCEFLLLDPGINASPDKRRTTLNIQNILKLESYLDRVMDPWAGSYFIEDLSFQLAKKSWERFANSQHTEA